MLRSMNELKGYVLEAIDGEIGRCKDFLFEDETWAVRHMVANTGNWLPGRNVLISPDWVNFVDWPQKAVGVDMTRDAVKNSPEYDPTAPVNRAYEVRLYDFYGRSYYW